MCEERTRRIENTSLRLLKLKEEQKLTDQEALKIGIKVVAGIAIFRGLVSLLDSKPPPKT